MTDTVCAQSISRRHKVTLRPYRHSKSHVVDLVSPGYIYPGCAMLGISMQVGTSSVQRAAAAAILRLTDVALSMDNVHAYTAIVHVPLLLLLLLHTMTTARPDVAARRRAHDFRHGVVFATAACVAVCWQSQPTRYTTIHARTSRNWRPPSRAARFVCARITV
jgi:hypothetical protein